MKTFKNIKTFTYIGNKVIVDGVEYEIDMKLSDTIHAVQFHKGYTKLIEEKSIFKKVSFTKYQPILDLWNQKHQEYLDSLNIENQEVEDGN